MPGFHLALRCAACDAQHRLHTGHGAGWAFEQLVCHRCEAFRSVAFTEDLILGPCPDCGLQLEAWPGRFVGDTPVGPCPACLMPLGPHPVIERSAWD